MAQQIQKKFIGNDQVDGSKLLLLNNQSIRKLDGSGNEFDVIANIESQIDAEESRALAAEGAIASDLAQEVLDRVAGDAATLSSANSYADQKVADLVNGAPGILDTLSEIATALGNDANLSVTLTNLISGVQSGLDQEIVDRAAADSSIQSELDATQSGAGLNADGSYTVSDNGFQSFIAGTTTLKGSIDALDLALIQYDLNLGQEILDRTNGDAALQTELDATQVGAGLGTDGSYTAPVGSNYLGLATSLKDGDSKLDAQIKVVADDLAQEILDRAADVDAEETRALAAESALDVRVTALEGALVPTWTRQKFDLTATNISNGYIDLAQNAIAESIHAFVDRLAIHQGEDFTVSVVSGVTRITFAGDLVSPGNSSLDANDNIYVRYQYLA